MNLIFCAYADMPEYMSGHNLKSNNRTEVYLKNAFIALKSCKNYNPTDEVALITNFTLSNYWADLFTKHNIKIYFAQFDSFLFDKEYKWSLAYYKLCALRFSLDLDYENYVLLDTDTYTQRSFTDIWCECKHNILLPEINKGLYNVDYLTFCREAQAFLSTDEYLTRYGGEFIAGNKALLLEYTHRCRKIYDKMLEIDFVTINGDEFIESIAAWELRVHIKTASAYVFRYWTAYKWYYICSNFSHNPVCVLHCPREKDYGFIKIFNYFVKHNRMPNAKQIYSFLSLDLKAYILRYFTMKFIK